MTSAKSSSDIRSSSPSRVIPALATRISTGPCRSSTAAKAASTCWAEVTSHATADSPSGASPEREVTVTAWPASARAWAMASPMPRLPPVTRAERPTSASCR